MSAPPDTPRMLAPQALGQDYFCLPAWLPVPGHGLLCANAHLVRGAEPMLVDTGVAALGDDFMAALEACIDPADLRWIWLSHTDADHTGNLVRVLDAAPRATVLTGFLGLAKMELQGLPLDRVQLLDPDAAFVLPDRELVPVRPPYYDAPESTGFFDTKTRSLFCVDAFGALLPQPEETAAAIAPATLEAGLAAWSALDAPWLAMADRDALAQALQAIMQLDPRLMISGHLPPAFGMAGELAGLVRHVYGGKPAAPGSDLLARLAA